MVIGAMFRVGSTLGSTLGSVGSRIAKVIKNPVLTTAVTTLAAGTAVGSLVLAGKTSWKHAAILDAPAILDEAVSAVALTTLGVIIGSVGDGRVARTVGAAVTVLAAAGGALIGAKYALDRKLEATVGAAIAAAAAAAITRLAEVARVAASAVVEVVGAGVVAGSIVGATGENAQGAGMAAFESWFGPLAENAPVARAASLGAMLGTMVTGGSIGLVTGGLVLGNLLETYVVTKVVVGSMLGYMLGSAEAESIHKKDVA